MMQFLAHTGVIAEYVINLQCNVLGVSWNGLCCSKQELLFYWWGAKIMVFVCLHVCSLLCTLEQVLLNEIHSTFFISLCVRRRLNCSLVTFIK